MRTALVALIVTLGAPLGASGALAFDFEDGLQGWTAFGSVTRVPTQVLGGSYAIFGDGLWRSPEPFTNPNSGSVLALEQPPDAPYDQLHIDFHFAGTLENFDPTSFLAVGRAALIDGLDIRAHDLLPLLRVDLRTDRSGTLVFDIGEGTGPAAIEWLNPRIVCSPTCGLLPADIGFIDNITFLPEPSGVLLMVLVGVGGVVWRRS